MLTSDDMNPYASFLGERDPVTVIASTPGHLKTLVDRIGDTAVNHSPAPGKWSVREILCHLADTEIVFAFRLRQTLAEPHYVIQPFDQDHWAARYAAYDATTALEAFTAVRNWNLELIAGVKAEERKREVTHPERGTMTFQVLLETMGGHDANHLLQVEKIAA